MDYAVGDTLGVFPRNCPDLVRRILRAVDIARDEPVQFDGEWFTIRDILIYRKDIVTIDRRLLTTIASARWPRAHSGHSRRQGQNTGIHRHTTSSTVSSWRVCPSIRRTFLPVFGRWRLGCTALRQVP